jgi:hypothetical protein
MAGGIFDTQNKVRAGVYIRFRSAQTDFLAGSRGVVALRQALSWGPVGVVSEITAQTDVEPVTGYPYSDSRNRFLQEIFKGTNRSAGPAKVLLFRPEATGAATATATIGALNITAQYPGARGNDVSVAVIANVGGGYTVNTIVDGAVVDSQIVASASALVANSWVKFSGSAALTANTGTPLTGGADGTVAASAEAAFLTAIEPYHFDVLLYDGADATVIASYKSFIERIANEAGKYAQLVVANAAAPDSRFVINVVSGVTLADGTVLTPAQTTWWVAGATAGALYNQSLTFAEYPDAVQVSPALSPSEATAAILAGKFVLFADSGVVRVESDIDSLVTFSQEIGRVFHKNRTMRLLNQIANDLYAELQANYIGVINNDAAGRSRIKAAVVGYLLGIQANGGIQNFSADDVTIEAGEEADAVVITIVLQATDSAEKIYITLVVR